MNAIWIATTGMLVVASLGFVWWVVRRVQASQRDTGAKLPPLPPMSCPRCGQAMETGATLTGRGLIWLADDRAPRWRDNALWNSLPNTLATGFRVGRNPARRCAGCRVLVVDYSTALH